MLVLCSVSLFFVLIYPAAGYAIDSLGRSNSVLSELEMDLTAFRSAVPVATPAEPATALDSFGDFAEEYNPGPDFADPDFPLGGAIDKNVFTGNKRVKVKSTKYPFSVIGSLDLAKGGQCTASLVGRDLILTNGHCLLDGKNNFVEGDYVFRPNYTDGKSLYSSEATFAWWGSTATASGKRWDWAILRLSEPLGRKLGWLEIKILPDLKNVPLFAVSYSGDFEDGKSASLETDCSITSAATSFGLVRHNCSNSRGASGSPMFIKEKDESGKDHYFIIALHTAEYRSGDSSYINIPYSDKQANLALPAKEFSWKVTELLKPKKTAELQNPK